MVKALAEKGCTVHVYSTSPNMVKIDNVVWKQILVHFPNPIRTWGFFLLFPLISAKHAVFKTIDRVIAFGPIYASLLLPLKIFETCTVYCMVRGMLSIEYRYQGRKRYFAPLVFCLERVGCRVSDRMIVVSQTLKEVLQHRFKVPEKKVFCLPNEIPRLNRGAVDVGYGDRIWKECAREEDVRLFAGGVITPIKNYEMLFHVAESLRIPFHICIAGAPASKADEAYYCHLKHLAIKLGMETHVTWLGWLERRNLLGVIQTSHLVISSSHHEGMSNILLEALALGTPCFAVDTPESFELLGSKNLLFKTPETLAEMIEKFVLNDFFARETLEQCRKAREKWSFDWEAMLADLILKE